MHLHSIDEQILLDHHAHTLREGFLQLDAVGLRQAFSETRSLSQLEQHVQHTVSYMDCLRKLSKFLDVPNDESTLLDLRTTMKERNYINMLFDDASIGAFIIDDGFVPQSGMSLAKFAQLSERPVFCCRRIETVLEHAVIKSESFDSLELNFENHLLKNEGAAIVSLKTIAAYRGGLSIDLIGAREAASDFERVRAELMRGEKARITRSALYHYFLLRAFAIAGQRNLPVQIHCGIGDQDEDLSEANPLRFRAVLETAAFNRTRFIFLHCYPFVREAGYLCSIYSNAYMDLSLTSFLATSALATAFGDALALAPASKI
ncbi:MAG: amidohydrolase family protein, partial [Terriglobales bacterium]